MTNRRERTRIADGHLSSHLVYGTPSFCWQHLEGQLAGQQQQQQRKGHANKNTKKGNRKAPTNMPRPIAPPDMIERAPLKSKLTNLFIKAFLSNR